MSSEADIAAQRQLSELAELSLEMARHLEGAMENADCRDMVRIADAFSKVGRCLRMCVALAGRLARGEALAPARRDRDLEADESEPDDWEEDFDSEPSEGLERETLFDRLPSGDLPTQVAGIARILASASRALPAASPYRARCEAVLAGVRRDLPRRPPDDARRVAQAPPAALGVTAAAIRSRGPPRPLG